MLVFVCAFFELVNCHHILNLAIASQIAVCNLSEYAMTRPSQYFLLPLNN